MDGIEFERLNTSFKEIEPGNVQSVATLTWEDRLVMIHRNKDDYDHWVMTTSDDGVEWTDV